MSSPAQGAEEGRVRLRAMFAPIEESLADELLADRLRQRIAEDDGTRLTFEEVCESLGLDPEQFDGTSATSEGGTASE